MKSGGGEVAGCSSWEEPGKILSSKGFSAKKVSSVIPLGEYVAHVHWKNRRILTVMQRCAMAVSAMYEATVYPNYRPPEPTERR